MRFQIVHLALVSRTHAAAGPVHDRRDVHAGLPRELRELAKARFEDALERTCVTRAARPLIERRKLGARPELLLEIVGLLLRALQLEALEEDVVPGKKRSEKERGHHELYQYARIGDEA